jgi:hypothetical protein
LLYLLENSVMISRKGTFRIGPVGSAEFTRSCGAFVQLLDLGVLARI